MYATAKQHGRGNHHINITTFNKTHHLQPSERTRLPTFMVSFTNVSLHLPSKVPAGIFSRNYSESSAPLLNHKPKHSPWPSPGAANDTADRRLHPLSSLLTSPPLTVAHNT